MTQQLTTKPTTSELKIQLQEAGTNRVLLWQEATPELETLSLEAAKIESTGVTSKEILKESGSVVARIKGKKKEISEARLKETRILDFVKDDLIERERELLKGVTDHEIALIKINNDYVVAEDARVKAAEKKILDEKNQKIELDSMKVALDHRYSVALTTEVSNMRTNFATSWAGLTKETFESRVNVLKKYTPKIDIEKINKYLEFTPKSIQPEQIEAQIKLYFDFSKFQSDYVAKVTEIRDEYLSKVEEKREELKTQSEAELNQSKAKANEDEISRKVIERLDLQASEEKLNEKIATVKTNAEIHAQGKMQVIKKVSGMRRTVAYIEGEVDWQSIVEKYIDKNGSLELEFLLDFLAKNGQPKIAGVVYKEVIVNVNRK